MQAKIWESPGEIREGWQVCLPPLSALMTSVTPPPYIVTNKYSYRGCSLVQQIFASNLDLSNVMDRNP